MNPELEVLIQEVKSKKLKSLVLSAYKLTEIPQEILACDWIEELIFGFYYDFEKGTFIHSGICYLQKLPADLSRLRNLKVLSLAGSPFGQSKPDITNFDEIFELTNLEYLYLDGTRINDVSRIGNLTKLKHLNLADTDITDYSPIGQLTQLECLTLGDNKIEDIQFLSALTRLSALSLTTNRIKSIAPLAGFTTLKRLCLCNNQLTDLNLITSNQGLSFLCAYANPINSYEFLSLLPALEHLNVPKKLRLSDIQGNLYLQKIVLSDVTNEDINSLNQFKQCTYLALTGDFSQFQIDSHDTIESIYLNSKTLQTLLFNGRLINLRTLGLIGTFEAITGTHNLTGLLNLSIESLNFSDGNGLTLPTIESLEIIGSNLSGLDFLSTLKTLKTLILQDIPDLIALDVLQHLKNLENVRLLNTPLLKDLAPLAILANLTSLRLFETGVEDLKPILHHLEKEDFELELSENRLPEKLMEYYYAEGKQGILNYYRSNT